MSGQAIRAVGLSKRFRIGQRVRYKSLRESIQNAVTARFRRSRRAEETIWALRDVSFEVAPGEVVGVIGRNGAGKSTLLKILSRITEPTEGRIELHGRVGSLLEVGTGFHLELTGRENIFLNGAILGMKRTEIARKFDEIVVFAEVEKFLDTPVKHYSTGMYLRLAFAVAAHLEPEILLVDEVLAVGDAAFQKKCLGKMGDVARGGRTVLFVSHNMAAVAALCSRAVCLDRGRVSFVGTAEGAIQHYVARATESASVSLALRTDRVGNGSIRFTAIRFLDGSSTQIETAVSGQPLAVELECVTSGQSSIGEVPFEIGFYDSFGQLVFLCGSAFAPTSASQASARATVICEIPRLPLKPGLYTLNVYCGFRGLAADWLTDAAQLRVVEGDFFGTGRLPPGNPGAVLVDHRWQVRGSTPGDGDAAHGPKPE